MDPRAALACTALIACASSPAPAPPPAPIVERSGPTEQQRLAQERARKDELGAAHRKLESTAQDALAASCADPPGAHARCLPSCYAPEPQDARAGTKRGGIAIPHLVCEQPGDEIHAGPFLFADELEPAKLAVRPVRGRAPKPHRKGTWQAALETALGAALKLPKGDALVVTGAWRRVVHPVTKESLRCTEVSHYVRSLRRALDGCGGDGTLACEGGGNAAVHGINIVHYRLAEARALQGAGKPEDCQQAALEAIAVARGLPRWRQYTQLNVGTWKAFPAFRTRFDGILDEDGLFAAAAALGAQAEEIHVACGGAAGVRTTPEQEQSFHACW